jgi:hypothetical protein
MKRSRQHSAFSRRNFFAADARGSRGLDSRKVLFVVVPQAKSPQPVPHHESVGRAAYGAALLGILLFWTGIVVARGLYPGQFDWRYMTLSTLISPHKDPTGYLWAAGGVVLSSVCAFCWAILLGWRANAKHGAVRPRGIRLLA